MPAVRQEGGVPAGRRARTDAQAYRLWVSTFCGDSVEPVEWAGHEHNHVILVPRASPWLPCGRERLDSARRDIDGLEFSVREESDLRSVRRPEGQHGAVSICEWLRTAGLESLVVQQLPAICIDRNESQPPAVGR